MDRMHDLQVKLDATDGWSMQNKVDTTLDRLNLAGASLMGTLSGGMQKRVALARAIAAKPEIIFFDEPTTGLDPIRADVINDEVAGDHVVADRGGDGDAHRSWTFPSTSV